MTERDLRAEAKRLNELLNRCSDLDPVKIFESKKEILMMMVENTSTCEELDLLIARLALGMMKVEGTA